MTSDLTAEWREALNRTAPTSPVIYGDVYNLLAAYSDDAPSLEVLALGWTEDRLVEAILDPADTTAAAAPLKLLTEHIVTMPAGDAETLLQRASLALARIQYLALWTAVGRRAAGMSL